MGSMDELIASYVYLRIKKEKQQSRRRNRGMNHGSSHMGMAGGDAAAMNNINMMTMQGGMGGGTF